jgi:hypothetical protein
MLSKITTLAMTTILKISECFTLIQALQKILVLPEPSHLFFRAVRRAHDDHAAFHSASDGHGPFLNGTAVLKFSGAVIAENMVH